MFGGLVAFGALGATRGAEAVAEPSCDQIIAAMEEAGGSMSTDQIAAKLKTSPERVNACMAQSGGGKPSMVNPNQKAGPSGGSGAKGDAK